MDQNKSAILYKYMSNEAIAGKVEQIKRHIVQLVEVPGDVIPYNDILAIIQILADVMNSLNKRLEGRG